MPKGSGSPFNKRSNARMLTMSGQCSSLAEFSRRLLIQVRALFDDLKSFPELVKRIMIYTFHVSRLPEGGYHGKRDNGINACLFLVVCHSGDLSVKYINSEQAMNMNGRAQ
jgi:hypothetical protein